MNSVLTLFGAQRSTVLAGAASTGLVLYAAGYVTSALRDTPEALADADGTWLTLLWLVTSALCVLTAVALWLRWRWVARVAAVAVLASAIGQVWEFVSLGPPDVAVVPAVVSLVGVLGLVCCAVLGAGAGRVRAVDPEAHRPPRPLVAAILVLALALIGTEMVASAWVQHRGLLVSTAFSVMLLGCGVLAAGFAKGPSAPGLLASALVGVLLLPDAVSQAYAATVLGLGTPLAWSVPVLLLALLLVVARLATVPGPVEPAAAASQPT
ncbi:MAG TPA: hypothetical protein VH008_19900 [Pseudonocardia sp.]|nr:hypothetical protein [Pseudonocardia sp.]